MSNWPQITEPALLDRLAMDDREFEAFIRFMASQIPPRTYDATLFEQAIGYPWARPDGSYLLTGGEVEAFDGLGAAERGRALDRFTSDGSGRLPVLSIGSNGSPETLERKFAHFPDEDDRTVLALTGRLHDFDVGVAAQPTIYGAMPATLFPSTGTAACATVLWVTPAQFAQLTWSEISYRLGKLRTRFDIEEGATHFDEVLVFISRFGAFCIDERPVALAAIPAEGRTADALTQEQLLDAAAELAIEPGAHAETLVRAIFEDISKVGPKIAATVWKASQPFESERWTPFSPALPRKKDC